MVTLTKQEETCSESAQSEVEVRRRIIREGIALKYLQWKENDTCIQLKDIDDFFRSECFNFADELMKQEDSQGVVIKVDKKINGNLINELYDAMGVIGEADCRLLVKQALDKAGYVAVDSLISDVSPTGKSMVGSENVAVELLIDTLWEEKHWPLENSY